MEMVSPDGNVKTILSDKGGKRLYCVNFHEQEVIAPSELGIVLNGDTFNIQIPLK